MAITNAVANSFKVESLDGIHLAADVYKIALYTSAATLSKATTAYSATNEVANGGGYTTGGATLAGRSNTLVTDSATLTWTSPTWSAATITARGALIYNSSRSNKAVFILDFGSDVISTADTFTVTLPANLLAET